MPRFPLACRGLAQLAVAAAFSLSAYAQDKAYSVEPSGKESAIIASCVGSTSSIKEGERCIGKVAEPCNLGGDARVTPKGRARVCVQTEERIWDELLNRWYADKVSRMPPEALQAVRKAQRAWIEYRDAKCGVAIVLEGGALGMDNHYTCRLEEVARRALEIRDLNV